MIRRSGERRLIVTEFCLEDQISCMLPVDSRLCVEIGAGVGGSMKGMELDVLQGQACSSYSAPVFSLSST